MTTKYTPTTISQLTCNRTGVDTVHYWLDNYELIKQHVLEIKKVNKRGKAKIANIDEQYIKNSLTVVGPHGIGKTLSVKIILEELQYRIIPYNQLPIKNIKTIKDVKDAIEKIIYSYDIVSLINGTINKKVVILVDELECVTSNKEKHFLTTLQKLNDENWYCPIIFISNNQHNKLLSDIKKISLEVKFYHPSVNDMKVILKNIVKTENITINEPFFNKIIEESQQDVRRLIMLSKEIKKNPSQNTTYFDNIMRKDVSIDIYRATESLIYNYENIGKSLKIYEMDKVTIPLMIHQIYPRVLYSTYINTPRPQVMLKISKCLVKADLIENYIYGEQAWQLQDAHGFLTCCYPSWVMNRVGVKKGYGVKMEYPSDLHKTSTKKINKKNIKNANGCFKNSDVLDYVYMNKIFNKLLVQGKTNKITNILNSYNALPHHIESLIKIDKIDDESISKKEKDDFKRKKDNFIKKFKN